MQYYDHDVGDTLVGRYAVAGREPMPVMEAAFEVDWGMMKVARMLAADDMANEVDSTKDALRQCFRCVLGQGGRSERGGVDDRAHPRARTDAATAVTCMWTNAPPSVGPRKGTGALWALRVSMTSSSAVLWETG